MTAVADVKSCTTDACAYHEDGCTAFAVTITGSPDAATCGTFISLGSHGGLPTARAHVGACQRSECAHNTNLMCTSESIMVGPDHGCLTYTTA